MIEENQEFTPSEADQEAVQVDAPEVDEPEAETPEPAPVAKDWTDEDEEEARLFGWKSPEEWQGEKPPGYIDNPQTFLNRVTSSRIFKTMAEKQAEQARKLETINQQALDRQRREYEDRLKQITAQQRRAVEEADTDAYDRLETQRQEMLRQQPVPQQDDQEAQLSEVRRAVAARADKSPWINDPAMRAEGKFIVDAALQSGHAFQDYDEQIDYAEKALKLRYPHMFEAKAAPKQRVDGGGLGSGPTRQAGTFEKLPSEAKSAFSRFVSQGIFTDSKTDREEYAREYNNA